MAITAALVKELRDMTGAGMMDAKKALVETDGNIKKAIKGSPNHYLKRNMGSLQTRLCKLPWHSNKAIRI